MIEAWVEYVREDYHRVDFHYDKLSQGNYELYNYLLNYIIAFHLKYRVGGLGKKLDLPLHPHTSILRTPFPLFLISQPPTILVIEPSLPPVSKSRKPLTLFQSHIPSLTYFFIARSPRF